MCVEICQGPDLGQIGTDRNQMSCLDSVDNRDQFSYRRSSAPLSSSPRSFVPTENPKSSWSLRGRKLMVATAAAAGLGSLATAGTILPAAAGASEGSCVDEGNGDGWGVNPDTNEGCLIPGANAAAICLDDNDSDDRGVNPTTNDGCDLPEISQSPETGKDHNPEPDPNNSDDPSSQTTPQPAADEPPASPPPEAPDERHSATETTPSARPASDQASPTQIGCRDEGNNDGWGVDPATNKGCWEDGVKISACTETGPDQFECPDGLLYDSDGNTIDLYQPAQEPAEPTRDSGVDYTNTAARIVTDPIWISVEVEQAYETFARSEESDPPRLAADASDEERCMFYGGSPGYYVSDGMLVCSECIDDIGPPTDSVSLSSLGSDADSQYSGVTQCWTINLETGEKFIPDLRQRQAPNSPADARRASDESANVVNGSYSSQVDSLDKEDQRQRPFFRKVFGGGGGGTGDSTGASSNIPDSDADGSSGDSNDGSADTSSSHSYVGTKKQPIRGSDQDGFRHFYEDSEGNVYSVTTVGGRVYSHGPESVARPGEMTTRCMMGCGYDGTIPPPDPAFVDRLANPQSGNPTGSSDATEQELANLANAKNNVNEMEKRHNAEDGLLQPRLDEEVAKSSTQKEIDLLNEFVHNYNYYQNVEKSTTYYDAAGAAEAAGDHRLAAEYERKAKAAYNQAINARDGLRRIDANREQERLAREKAAKEKARQQQQNGSDRDQEPYSEPTDPGDYHDQTLEQIPGQPTQVSAD